MHTTHTSRSQSWGGNYISREENTRSMQLKIDCLHRRLCYEQRRRTTSDSNPLLMMMKVVATGLGLGLPLMSLFHMMRTVITDEGVKTHLAKVWAMMLWVGLLTRSLNHRLRVELKGENFLGGLLSQHSPCIMVEWTLWSTLATSTREWSFTPGTKPWCAMFPSSLEPVAMRWFDGLKEGFISSFRELTRAFGARFVTCSRFLSSWIPYYPWPCERRRPWKCIWTDIGRCSIR